MFQRTWRHPYVPRFYTGCGSGPLVSAADGHHRNQWLAAGYSDESLITKMVPTPTRKAGWFTSSSTMPSPMLTMLEALDVANGCRVLEIGTGSGYDRIIATCSVAVIPPVWLKQVVPGGVIMTDVRGQLGGTVVRLTMNDDGTASGRFLPCYVSFMSPPLSPSSTSGRASPTARTAGTCDGSGSSGGSHVRHCGPVGSVRIAAVPHDDLESRVTSLEHEVVRLREQVAITSSDAAAARVLAAGADRDVSEVRAELRAHTQGLNALRETQLELRETQLEQGRELVGLRRDLTAQGQELVGLRRDLTAQGQELVGLRRDLTAQGQELVGLRQEMREGFATLSTGMAELTTLLTKITEAEQGN